MSPALTVDERCEAMLVHNSVANLGVQDNEKNKKQMGHQHITLLCSAAFMVMQSLHAHITLQETYCLNYNTNLVKTAMHIVKQQHSLGTLSRPCKLTNTTCPAAQGHTAPSKD